MYKRQVYSTLKRLTNDRNVSAYNIVKRKNGSGGHNRVFTSQCMSKLKKKVYGKTAFCRKEKLVKHLEYHSKESLVCSKELDFII